jgi:S-DNA-T family DNA segregation ATPase FtsK/SpoIIIE
MSVHTDEETRPRLSLVKDGVPLPAVPDPEPLDGVVVEYDFEERDLPAWLPLWATSREGIEAYARWRAKWAGHMAVFHAIRTPKYGVRLIARGVIGTARGVGGLLGWVFHAEARPLRKLTVEQGNVSEYIALTHLRNEYVRLRGCIAGGGAIGTAIVVAVEVAVFPPALVVEAFLGLAIAARWGGPEGQSGLLDQADLPIQLDLSADALNAAFRACGLLKGKDDDEHAPRLLMIRPPMRDAKGWSAILDLPRGGGKAAADALAKRDVIAAELGVDEIQLDMRRVRAVHGGHAGRVSMWVSDDDPYIGDKTLSPLQDAEQFSIWDSIPYGRDARGNRVSLDLMWQSMFFGGLPRRGKTTAQRIPSAAGALDATVRHWVADGKGGGDWRPIGLVAHRYVLGAEAEAITALEAMFEEVIDEMEAAYRILRKVPTSLAPDAKLTPAIQKRYKLPINMVTVDELQEYLTAIADQKRRDALIDMACRIARRGPAAGFISNFASQRPDADSVPTRLREIITIRSCTQVIDRTSSDMVLGKGKAAQGADASILSEEHVGVQVLVTGPASFTTVKCDYLDVPAFAEICQRGRTLRQAAGTLTGDAVDDVLARAEVERIPQVLSDALNLMRHAKRMHTTDLLNRLVNFDEDSYGEWSAERLAEELARAGVERSTTQVKIGGVNRNGYNKSDLEAAAENFEPAP